MFAIKSEMQVPCTLIKTETKYMAEAQENVSNNVIPKAESSFCSDYNETKCFQNDFMQHDGIFGQELHNIKIEPAAQTNWRCDNVPKVEMNSQDSTSFIKIEQQHTHIVKKEWPHMTELNHIVKSERSWPGQDAISQLDSDNEFYWNCQGDTYEVKTQYAKGPVTSEVKHEDHSGQGVGSAVESEQTKSHTQSTIMEHLKAQSVSQQVEWNCRKNKDISACISSPELQDVDVVGCKNTQVTDIVTESPQHERNVNLTEATISTESEKHHSRDIESDKCKECMSSFHFSSLHKKHMSHHTGKTQKCRVCKAAFTRSERPHQCSLCKAAFKTSSNLKSHLRVHSNKKSHQCNVCKTAFKRLLELKSHMAAHSDQKPHKCSVCKAAFKRLYNLKIHMLVHSDQKPHKCSVCKAAFKRLSDLKTHMLVHSDQKPHKCSVCKAAFKTLSEVKKHMLVHSDQKPQKCSVCKAAFKRLSELKNHMLVHSDQKPHKCSVCKAAFKRLSELKKHMLVHSDQKPQKCSVCKAAFKRLFELKGHMLVHSDQKPHKCSVCKAAFKRLYNLKIHMLVHSDKKPHKCSVCKAAFKRLSDLKKHIMVHSDQKPQECI